MKLINKKSIVNLTNHWFSKILIHFIISTGSIFLLFIKFKILFFIAIIIPFFSLTFYILTDNKKIFSIYAVFLFLEIVLTIVKIFIISPFDFYATNIVTPKNISYNLPKLGNVDSLLNEFKNAHLNINQTDFELFRNNSEGIYYYIAWYKPTMKGYLYLKAFEVTQNDTLSPNSVKMSSIKIDSVTNLFQNLQPRRTFCIKEGDNGDYYITRFELWFKASNNDLDTLLQSKNYKISGFEKY